MNYVVGLDVSTTATKAVLVDGDGRLAAVGTSEYGVEAPRPRWSEQHPDLWWQATQDAIAQVLQATRVGGHEVAVGLAGQMHGAVLLDRRHRVVRPAILWNDQRTAEDRDRIRHLVGRDRLIAVAGNDALTGFTAPKLLWVREHEPDVWAEVAHVLLPKDHVRLHLTGELAADVADASGTLLLEVVGTPVIAGGGDQAANAVGVGAIDPGVVALSLGTSGVVFAATDAPVGDSRTRALVLSRRARSLAPDGGDAVRGRQPPVVA